VVVVTNGLDRHVRVGGELSDRELSFSRHAPSASYAHPHIDTSRGLRTTRDTRLTAAACSHECLKGHAGRREDVFPNGHKSARRTRHRAARKLSKDPFLRFVQRLVGHALLEPAIHNTDVDAKLIRPVGARVWSEIGHRSRRGHKVGNVEVELFAQEPQQDLIVQRHRPRIVAERGERKIVFRHESQNCHSAGRCSGVSQDC
jgi:hypothetical protein